MVIHYTLNLLESMIFFLLSSETYDPISTDLLIENGHLAISHDHILASLRLTRSCPPVGP